MFHLHSVFGLSVAANTRIPGLARLSSAPSVDVRVCLGDHAPWPRDLEAPSEIFYVSPERDENDRPLIEVRKLSGGAFLQILYHDGAQFVVDRKGENVWGTWSPPLTFDDAVVYLCGPVLGYVLRLRGVTCLHASAVAIDGQAVAFAGPPGSGKSTLAAAFAMQGHAILSDNIVPLMILGDSVLAQPGSPRICLMPDTVQALCGSPEALPLVAPNWDKRFLELPGDGHRFQSDPLPVGAVYLLGGSSPNLGKPGVERLPIQEGLMALIANTYLNYLLDPMMRVREFEVLGRISAKVPLRRLGSPVGEISPFEVCEIIRQDFQQLFFAGSRGPT